MAEDLFKRRIVRMNIGIKISSGLKTPFHIRVRTTMLPGKYMHICSREVPASEIAQKVEDYLKDGFQQYLQQRLIART